MCFFPHNFTAFCLYLYLLFYDSHNTLLNYIKEKNLHVDKLLHCFTAFVCCQYKKKKTKSHLCYVLHLLYCFSQTHYELTPFTLFAFFFFGLLLNGIIFCKQNKSFGSQEEPSFFFCSRLQMSVHKCQIQQTVCQIRHIYKLWACCKWSRLCSVLVGENSYKSSHLWWNWFRSSVHSEQPRHFHSQNSK